MRRILVLTLVLFQLALGSAVADLEDLVSTRRAGPFKRGVTTFEQAREWFGRPDRVTHHDYQCIRVKDARWSNKFRVTFNRFDNTMVVAIIKRRSVNSEQHGRLAFHTSERLRVADGIDELEAKYPNARRHQHNGYAHHILRSNETGRLEATTEDGRVTELRSFPYEAC